MPDSAAPADPRAAIRALAFADEAGAGARARGRDRAVGRGARGDRRPRRRAGRARCGERSSPTVMEAFLAEYGLSSDEGVGLMCLAEALLRVPDAETIDELIADKIEPSNWGAHLGRSTSSLVNAATWGLLITGRVLDDDPGRPAAALRGLIRRVGEPVVRTAVGRAMKLMGRQFVLGETIGAAMDRARGARGQGLHLLLRHARRGGAHATPTPSATPAPTPARSRRSPPARPATCGSGPGISVKLSALHPRYEWSHRDDVMAVLLPRARDLARAAARAPHRLQHRRRGGRPARPVARRDRGAARRPAARGLGRLRRRRPGLRPPRRRGDRPPRRPRAEPRPARSWCGWSRAPTGTARSSGRRRRACPTSRSSPASPRPTSATSPTPASCSTRATASTRSSPPTTPTPSPRCWRWPATRERLRVPAAARHGRGAARDRPRGEGTRCRIYAPVGAHRDLLAYLVRRLLENGANSSFVNQIVDKDLAAARRSPPTRSPRSRRFDPIPNPAIRRPARAVRAAAELGRLERQRAGLGQRR